MAYIEDNINIDELVKGLEHIITLPVFNWDNMVAEIPMQSLYLRLKEILGGSPLRLTAEGLLKASISGDAFVITTGFYVKSSETLETDGPIGALAVARALHIASKKVPVLIVPTGFANSMTNLCITAGLRPFRYNGALSSIKDGYHAAVVEEFPINPKTAEKRASEIIKQINPTALLSVECPDRNEKGVYHRAKGFDTSEFQAKFPILYDLAHDSGIFTAGIGDFGNEIGMNPLLEMLYGSRESHRVCRCGCGGGIVGSTKTSSSLIANISNWGAYGLADAIALLSGKRDATHTPEMEHRLLVEAAKVGYVDATTGFLDPSEDGSTDHVSSTIVDLMSSIVGMNSDNGYKQYYRTHKNVTL
jgi:hypothetical protein